MFDEAAYGEERLTLAPGDVIVAFSDGVSEALNEAGEEYTDERLLAAVEANRDERRPNSSRRCSPTFAGFAGPPLPPTT